MKFKRTVILFAVLIFGAELMSQCTNTVPYGFAVAPVNGDTVTVTDWQWAVDYATIISVAASTVYMSTSSKSDFFTVRYGSYNGAVIAFGDSPLTWTSTSAGTYYIHCNTNSLCHRNKMPRTTKIQHVYTILPIELIDFYATCDNGATVLKWSTISETNNSHFILQRSDNAIDYESFASVNGAGNCNIRQDYSFIDENPLAYYRLIQIDYDNTQTVMGDVAAICDNTDILVYPNPTTGKTSMIVSSDLIGAIISIHGINGELVSMSTIMAEKTNIELYKNGIYNVILKLDDKVLIRKIIKI